jgi:hypothetical protein
MHIIIYLFLLVLLLILIVLFTAIGLTFKLKVQALEEKKEYGGTFTVKWLLFSHTFLIEQSKAEGTPLEEPGNLKTEHEVVETEDWQEKKGFEQREYKIEDHLEEQSKIEAEKSRLSGEKRPEEKTVIVEGKKRVESKEKIEIKERVEHKEKTNLIDKIRGKTRLKKDKKIEPEKIEPEKGITTREKLYWGLEAFKSLRKPLFRLFSDTLHGIKIKRLESYLTFGLSDPADTGMLCGAIHSIAGLIYSRCKHCSFFINPVFMNPMLDFQGNAEIRVRIYSLIFPVIKFIFNRQTLSFTYSIGKEILQREWKSRRESNPKMEV